MKSGASALSYAVRPRAIGYYLAQLLIVLAALTLVPLLVSIYYSDYVFTWRLGAVAALLVLAGAPLLRLPAPTGIRTNEALVVVALTFVIASLLMSYPLAAGGMTAIDAWLESVSGVTTTGLSTVARVSDEPHTFLFLRSFMQWYGGLGIVVLSLALLTGHHMAARRLVQPGADEPLATTARIHARHMLEVYLVLTACSIGLLWALGLSGFDAIVHAMSAVSTGGFSSFDGNLGGMAGWAPRFAVGILAFCGALPLVLYYRAFHRDWRAALQDVELRGLVIAVMLAGALMSGLLFAGARLGARQSIANGMLLGLSAQTTAGFTSLKIAQLGAAAKLVLITAMAVGGSVGSTAGGIKMLRLLILLKLTGNTVRRSATATHAVVEPRLADRALEQDDIARAALLMFLFLLVVLLSWLAFVARGYAPIDALFEVTSAAATAGLSTGVTAATLATPLKVLLGLDMLLGRLEIVALLVLFYPPTWFGKRGEAQ